MYFSFLYLLSAYASTALIWIISYLFKNKNVDQDQQIAHSTNNVNSCGNWIQKINYYSGAITKLPLYLAAVVKIIIEEVYGWCNRVVAFFDVMVNQIYRHLSRLWNWLIPLLGWCYDYLYLQLCRFWQWLEKRMIDFINICSFIGQWICGPFVRILKWIQKQIDDFCSLIVRQFIAWIYDPLAKLYNRFLMLIRWLFRPLIRLLRFLHAQYVKVVTWIHQRVVKFCQWMRRIYNTIHSLVTIFIDFVGKYIVDPVGRFFIRLFEYVARQIEIFIDLIQRRIIVPLVRTVTRLWNYICEQFTQLVKLVCIQFNQVMRRIRDFLMKLIAPLIRLYDAFISEWNRIVNRVREAMRFVRNIIRNIIKSIWRYIISLIKRVWNPIKGFILAILNIIKQIWTPIKLLLKFVRNRVREYWTRFKSILKSTIKSISEFIKSIRQAARVRMTLVRKTIREHYVHIRQIVVTRYRTVETFIKNGIKRFIQRFKRKKT